MISHSLPFRIGLQRIRIRCLLCYWTSCQCTDQCLDYIEIFLNEKLTNSGSFQFSSRTSLSDHSLKGNPDGDAGACETSVLEDFIECVLEYSFIVEVDAIM